MKLFIAEKPSLAQAISVALGKGVRHDGFIEIQNENVIVTWCFGHILELKEPHEYKNMEHLEKWNLSDLPFSPAGFELKVKSDTSKQFKIIQKLIAKADQVINAGDPDREGQLLVDEVLDFCNWKGVTKRVLISDMNINNIKKSIKNLKPNEEFQNLYYSAQARSYADWLFGLNLSRFYSLKAQQNDYRGVLSIGRVQTPILGLIVKRYLENKNHVTTPYYKIEVIGQHEGQELKFQLETEHKILEKEAAIAIQKEIQGGKGIVVEEINTTTKKKNPPLPFSLVDLQKKAATEFNYSPDETLGLIQKLYEEYKILTYPRSDCSYLPEEHFQDRIIIASNLKSNLSQSRLLNEIDLEIKSKAWNNKKITAHHAIIPTTKAPELDKLSEKEKNIYTLVANRYLLQFTKQYIYDSTIIVAISNQHKFKISGNKIIQQGYMAYENEKSTLKDNILPSLSQGVTLPVKEVNVITDQTRPLPLFTDASLLEAITKISNHVKNPKLAKILKETSGLGTPATQADIIKKLFARNFIEKKNKNIIPTKVGESFINVLPEYLTVPDTTAYWELLLTDIEEGKFNKEQFLGDLKDQIAQIISNEKNTEIKIKDFNSYFTCPKCNEQSMTESAKNFYCKNKSCDFVLWKNIAGKKLTIEQAKQLLLKKKTQTIKGFKNKEGKSFSAKLLLEKDFKVSFLVEKNKSKKRKK